MGAHCCRLAADMRFALGDGSDSILHALLPSDTGTELTIRDQDVGRRLVEADRIALVTMIRRLCGGAQGGSQGAAGIDGGLDRMREDAPQRNGIGAVENAAHPLRGGPHTERPRTRTSPTTPAGSSRPSRT